MMENQMRPDGMHPLKQLRWIRPENRNWCGNYSSISITSCAGLPVRLVACGKREQKHSCASKLFKGTEGVGLCDLTARNILVCYHEKWLNAIDIQRLSRYTIKDPDLMAFHFAADTLVKSLIAVSSLTDHYFLPFTFILQAILEINFSKLFYRIRCISIGVLLRRIFR
jgi:hypothetical protein